MTRPARRLPAAVRRRRVRRRADGSAGRADRGRVLIVGAGPAGLACAIRLGQLLEESPEACASGSARSRSRCSRRASSRARTSLSGAVVNPRSLRAPVPRCRRGPTDMPFYGQVEAGGRLLPDRHNSAMRIPTPPTMKNHGNYVASLSQLGALARGAGRGGGRDDPPGDGRARSCSSRTAASSESAPATRAAAASASGCPTSSRARTSSRRSRSSAEGTQGHLTGVAIDTSGSRARARRSGRSA